jgi:hypothetical protein
MYPKSFHPKLSFVKSIPARRTTRTRTHNRTQRFRKAVCRFAGALAADCRRPQDGALPSCNTHCSWSEFADPEKLASGKKDQIAQENLGLSLLHSWTSAFVERLRLPEHEMNPKLSNLTNLAQFLSQILPWDSRQICRLSWYFRVTKMQEKIAFLRFCYASTFF